MSSIVLSTLNARYIHSALGLRYLKANLGDLQSEAQIIEFIVTARPIDIVEQILMHQPRIIGLGVYIWNVEQTTQVVALLKEVRPDIIIVLGGPEVSYECDAQRIVSLADYVVCGAGEVSFRRLCRQVINNDLPFTKVITPNTASLSELVMPYDLYTDEDISHRVLYVEASRGCPFKCAFCLSALDKTAWSFEIDLFLMAMDRLYERGARRFKFVDRTFNLKIDSSIKILEFFLERLDDDLFLHFEVIPDHLPEKLKTVIQKFPEGSLQFEIGIQTFNAEVQSLISRKQDTKKSQANILWLRNETNAHLHTDLIWGLPGEGIESIAYGFNQLVACKSHEIQVGILKRLRGTPLVRHTEVYKMKYAPYPPYQILSTSQIDFFTMQRLVRFSRYWDLIANNGRFKNTLPLILGEQPFERFMQLSDWLYKTTGQTHKLALPRLFKLLYQGVCECYFLDEKVVSDVLLSDFQESGLKGQPGFIEKGHSKNASKDHSKTIFRQKRHI